jgi:pimeloyl-ACP methyl ester carboxylesterase
MTRASVLLTTVLLSLGALAAIPTIRYISADQERLTLDPVERQKAPNGEFAGLSQGVTHYQVGGPWDSRRTVLLVTGFSTPYNIWDPTFEGLTAAGYRVIRYDLYGRGYSDRPEGEYDANFYDRQALDLIDFLGVDKVDVGGVSMGGPLAAAFAARHPQRVRTVMLFDPGYFNGNRAPWTVRAPLVGEYGMAVRIAPTLAKSQWTDFRHPERYPRYLDGYYAQMQYRGFRRALLETIRNYVSTDVRPDYADLGKSRRPVLIVWGREDRDTPVELSTKLTAVIPTAELRIVEDAAHIPHYEHPEIVNPIVTAFLAHN